MKNYVVIGGVAGGMSAAARLRRLDESCNITVFEKGPYISYANCGLPYYIGDVIKDRNKLLVQTVERFSKRFNINVKVNCEVIEINRKNKQLKALDKISGEELKVNYDKLILSPGAVPIIPPIIGIDSPNIFTVRNVPDVDNIKGFIKNNSPKNALVIGGGYIGLEMAENLYLLGLNVSIVELSNQLMPLLDYELANELHRELESKGINYFLNTTVKEFIKNGNKLIAKLTNEKELEVDMVILAIGVKPDIKLAKECGLKIGEKGGIFVNKYLQTSDEDIYAIGDAIEVINPISNSYQIIPLAGPANKQGRIVADNIVYGNIKEYKGTLGTSVVKVFDLTVALSGLSEKMLKRENIPYESIILNTISHASYYPNAKPLILKLLFSKENGKIYGISGVGYDGVDKRIDVVSSIIRLNGTIYDLQEFEQAYAPPYSSAKDPINMLGFIAENIILNKIKVIHWDEFKNINSNEYFLLDVRNPREISLVGTIEGVVNIPLDELRQRINEVPKDKKIIIFCQTGVRSYIGARILMQNGIKEVYNLDCGYNLYSKL